jgi:Small-conductance mechanosensitive channel
MNKLFYTFLLTTSLVLAEDSAKVLQKTQNYCSKHPDKWQGHYNLGRMYYQNSDLENAEKCFSESIQRCEQPEHQEAILHNLGNTYFKQAEKAPEDPQKIPLLEKSIQNYEGAVALNKDAEDTQHNLDVAKKWLERLKKKQEQQKNQQQQQQKEEQKDQDRKKEDNKDSNKEPSKENKQEQQQENKQQQNKEQQQQPQPQNAKQQEMQNVLQKEQNNERILPINFSKNSNLPEDKVLKDW